MNLKDFIKETVKSIVDASKELEDELSACGAKLNPPLTGTERDVFDEDSVHQSYRRVEIVEFDVAITTSSESKGGGTAKLKIWSAEAGGKVSGGKGHQEVSRVKFSIPVALKPGAEPTK